MDYHSQLDPYVLLLDISKDLKLVNSISHTEIRSVLVKYGIKYVKQSKITRKQHRLRIPFKKRGLKIRYITTFQICILLSTKMRNKGLITRGKPMAVPHGRIHYTVKGIRGPKDKWILNVFGVYDNTNDQMYTQDTKSKLESSS